MELTVLKTDGSKTARTVTLPEAVFGIVPSEHAVYMDVRSIRDNSHLGLHKVKARSEVRGGGKKPWRQKGRGGARAGTIRSGVWVGGGSIFGPVPHDYHTGINKKVKRLAQKSALTAKATDNAVVIVEDFTFEKPATRSMVSVVTKLSAGDKKVLLLTGSTDKNVYLSGRNLQKVTVKSVEDFSTYDVVNADVLILQEKALSGLERLAK